MVQPVPQYLRGMRLKLGYFATWLPNEALAPGDIGILREHLFQKMSSLTAEGIDFATSKGSKTENITHLDGASVNVHLKAAGTPEPSMAVPTPKAGIAFDFVGEKSFVFYAQGCTVEAIDNLTDVERQIIEKYKLGEWDKPWHVVTHVVRADRTTILISERSGSRIEFSADGTLAAWTDLSAQTNIEIAREQGTFTKVVGQRSMTPLFRAARLKASILGSRVVPAGLSPMDMITPKVAGSDPNVELRFEEARALDDDT